MLPNSLLLWGLTLQTMILMTILFSALAILGLCQGYFFPKNFLPHRSVIIWSHPRSCSTVLWRCLQNISEKTTGLNEPFLFLKNADEGAIVDIQNTRLKDLQDLFKNVFRPLSRTYKKIIIKEHGYVYGQIRDMNIFKSVTLFPSSYIFLIRDPTAALYSYLKIQKSNKSSIRTEEISMIGQWRLYKALRGLTSCRVIVVDADELLEDPAKILKQICEKFNLHFSTKLLHWQALDNQLILSDFACWFSVAAKSTKFDASHVSYSKSKMVFKPLETLSHELLRVLSQNIKIYRKFKKIII